MFGVALLSLPPVVGGDILAESVVNFEVITRRRIRGFDAQQDRLCCPVSTKVGRFRPVTTFRYIPLYANDTRKGYRTRDSYESNPRQR